MDASFRVGQADSIEAFVGRRRDGRAGQAKTLGIATAGNRFAFQMQACTTTWTSGMVPAAGCAGGQRQGRQCQSPARRGRNAAGRCTKNRGLRNRSSRRMKDEAGAHLFRGYSQHRSFPGASPTLAGRLRRLGHKACVCNVSGICYAPTTRGPDAAP